MEELWKPINGYEEFFEVSNLGRIKALRRTHKRKGRSEWTTEEVIRNQKVNKDGYKAVSLNSTYYLVHRLVADAFIPKIDGKNQVNHIDCDKTNNVVSNLEWCNHSENQSHAYLNGLRKMKLDKKQYGEILLYRKAGLTYPEIAAKYNVSQQRVAKICSTYEIEMEMYDDPDFVLDLNKEMRVTPKILHRPKLDADGCLILKRVI